MRVGAEQRARPVEFGKKRDTRSIRLGGVLNKRLARQGLYVQGRKRFEIVGGLLRRFVWIERPEACARELGHPDGLQRSKLLVSGRQQRHFKVARKLDVGLRLRRVDRNNSARSKRS